MEQKDLCIEKIPAVIFKSGLSITLSSAWWVANAEASMSKAVDIMTGLK